MSYSTSPNFIDAMQLTFRAHSQTLPVDPFQIRVDGTTTSMIFSSYGRQIPPADVTYACFVASCDVVEAVVQNQGNGPVSTLQLQYWSGSLYMTIKPHSAMTMTWLILSHTVEGVVQFMQTYSWVSARFTILDDSLGIVGKGIISNDGVAGDLI